jgi:hypothetical protein
MIGAQASYRSHGASPYGGVGRRASCTQGSVSVSPRGAYTSANAGTSSVKTGEKPVRRKSEVSWATLIVPGLAGPKPRPKGVGDGQLVHIPAPPRVPAASGCITDGGTKEGRPTGRPDVSGADRRELRLANPSEYF